MYLKKLYLNNKWWFAVITLFIVMQLAMDIRQDITLSPVYHYGMYSQVILPQTGYVVLEITVNGNKLRTQDFTPAQWDEISYTAQLFNNQQTWNSLQWNADIKRLLHLRYSSKYINNITVATFNAWYKHYLQTVLHKKIDSLRIEFNEYGFNSNALTKIPQ